MCGAHFTEEQGIAMVMDRAEAGTVIATWYGTLNTNILEDNELFEGAFRKRFGISKTIEAAGGKLQTLKSSKFKNIDVFYEEFVDLVAVIGEARSHRDIVNNFLEALPNNIRTLVLLKSGLEDEGFKIHLDQLFYLAKKMGDLVPQSGGYAPGVNSVTHEEGGENNQVLAVQSGVQNVIVPGTP